MIVIAVGLNALSPRTSEAGIVDTLVATLAKDEINNKTYAGLPTDIRKNLNQKGFFGNEARAILQIKPSVITAASSLVLIAANQINRLTDIAIGRTVSKKEFQEAAEMTVAKEGIAKIGGPAATVTLTVVDAVEGAQLAQQVYQVAKGVTTDANPQVLAAKCIAWGLAREMDFINSRVSGAYQKIATLYVPPVKSLGDLIRLPLTTLRNLVTDRLELWFVFVQAGSQGNTLEKRGLLCYYRPLGSQRYQLYFSDVVSTTIDIKKK